MAWAAPAAAPAPAPDAHAIPPRTLALQALLLLLAGTFWAATRSMVVCISTPLGVMLLVMGVAAVPTPEGAAAASAAVAPVAARRRTLGADATRPKQPNAKANANKKAQARVTVLPEDV